jgi:hypothetical protein
VVLKIISLLVQEVFGRAILLTSLVDKLITLSGILNGVLPLKVKLMSFSMKSLELLSGLIELDLCSLSLGNLLLELFGLSSDLDGQLLDVQGQLLDFSLISTAILLEGQVVLFLLSGSKSPLLELLLIPVHLKLELVHLLVCLEDHVLDVIETVLLVGHTLLKLLNLILEPAALSFSDLFQVLLRFNLLVFNVHKRLSVHELHLDRLQMLIQDL